jgi:hypothetical protein
MEKAIKQFVKALQSLVNSYFDSKRARWQKLLMLPIMLMLGSLTVVSYAFVKPAKEETD